MLLYYTYKDEKKKKNIVPKGFQTTESIYRVTQALFNPGQGRSFPKKKTASL